MEEICISHRNQMHPPKCVYKIDTYIEMWNTVHSSKMLVMLRDPGIILIIMNNVFAFCITS